MSGVPVLSPVPMSRTGASRKKNVVQESMLVDSV
jgi:hypothetical protein